MAARVRIEELHQGLAKLADTTDAPHGLPLPSMHELRHPVHMSYGMRDYEDAFKFMQDRIAKAEEGETEAEGEAGARAFVCRTRDTSILEWEVNGWPVSQYVSIMAEYEYDSDADGVPLSDKMKMRRRWVSRRSLVDQKVTLLLDSWALRFGGVSAEAEISAQAYLLKRLNDQQQRSYVLGGSFVEESKRSGVAYLLRKGLPTLAFGKDNHLLCALCLHPFGAYVQSYVGIMPPSDEVLAHVLLIRADEHRFWKKSGQHAAWDPRSGV
jgi:hypothetical protein